MPRLIVFTTLALALTVHAATPAKPSLARRAAVEKPLVLADRSAKPAPTKSFLTASLPGPLAGMDYSLLLYFVFWYALP